MSLNCVMSRTLGSIALTLSLVMAPMAQPLAAESSTLEQRLEASLRQIDLLSRRLDQVEKELAAARGPVKAAPVVAAESAPVDAASVDARLGDIERTVGQLTAANGHDVRDTGLPLHGFADVGLAWSRHAPASQRDGFALGSVDFYLTPEFGENVKTLVELNFGTSEDGHTQADLERAQIGYAFSDALTVWLGRFHTPFGYWNMAFHHGAQIQPSILRPHMLDFEDDGGILPVHTTGAWATGGVRLGADKLNYNVYFGNGTRISNGSLNPNPAGDDNRNKVFGLGMNVRFGGTLNGLAVGANYLTQIVDAYDASNALLGSTRLNMFGAHAAYQTDRLEIIGEYYRLRNTDLSSATGTHGSGTGYAHFGYAIDERWVPYYRFERASLDQTDRYFSAQNFGRSYTRHVLGMRYNVDPRAALKVELVRYDDTASRRITDQIRLQYAVGF